MSSFCDYGNLSENYDQSRKPVGVDYYVGVILQRFRDRPAKNIRILDAGCGTGNYTAALLEQNIGTITLYDGNSGMLNRAKNKLKNAIDSGDITDITQAVLPNLPFADGSFDVVMFNQVLHHLPPGNDFEAIASTFKEVNRVLAPNGIIVISCCPGKQFGCNWYIQWHNEMFNKNYEFCKKSPTSQKTKNMLLKNGFSDVKMIVPLDDNYNDTIVYNKPESILDQSFRNSDSFWGFCTEEELEQLLKEFKAIQEKGPEAVRKLFDKYDEFQQQNGSYTIVIGSKGNN